LSDEFGYGRCVLFGRARSALVGLLEALDVHSGYQILIPSNVCPELLLAVWSSGANVRLLPVDPATGLVADSVLASAIRSGGRGMAIATQLYGFRQKHPETVAEARKRGWFLLENDTLATGARSVAGQVEPFADATLVSFGYSKTIDVGGGAILLNDELLANELRRKAKTYAPISDEARQAELNTMKLLREVRALSPELAGQQAEQLLLAKSIPALRYGFAPNLAPSLIDTIDRLPTIVDKRRKRAEEWERVLRPFEDEMLAPPLEPVVPWRLIRRLPSRRDDVVRALRESGFDAGTNFPPLASSFPNILAGHQFDDADTWGRQVLNLWVTDDYDSSRIAAAAKVIGKVLN
jgi:dTDP-4-amino-4,6-dideoxygalactose transaminase